MSKDMRHVLASVRRRIDATGAKVCNYFAEVDCIRILTTRGSVRVYWDGTIKSSFALARA